MFESKCRIENFVLFCNPKVLPPFVVGMYTYLGSMFRKILKKNTHCIFIQVGKMYRMQIRTFFQPFLSYIKSCKEKKSSIAEKRIQINLNYMWPLQEKFYLEFLYSGNLILVHSM